MFNMQNSELVKVLDWVETHYPEAYEAFDDEEYERDKCKIYKLLEIGGVLVGIEFTIPDFSKGFGFTYWVDVHNPHSIDYIKVSLDWRAEDLDFEDWAQSQDFIDNIQTFDDFVTAFNKIPK